LRYGCKLSTIFYLIYRFARDMYAIIFYRWWIWIKSYILGSKAHLSYGLLSRSGLNGTWTIMSSRF
jgi:hypothetical protein